MKNLLEQLRAVADDADTPEMARLILKILRSTAIGMLIEQYEASFLAAANDADTQVMAEIVAILFRELFAALHDGLPGKKREDLIQILKRAGDDADTPLMAKTFERLYALCTGDGQNDVNPYETTGMLQQLAEGEPPDERKQSQRIPAASATISQASSESVAMARERVVATVDGAKWEEVGPSLEGMLSSLAEARSDFEELPTWIAEVRASGGLGERVATAVEQADSILRKVINRYGDESDRLSVSQMRSQFLRDRAELPSGEFALFATDVAVRTAGLRNGVRRLPLAIRDNALHIGRHTRISFNRTLRIPEDGREYPLPAGFGRFPILRVEDYAKRVPEQWLEQGGFIIPLYQREALFLEFAGVQWRPTIGKVSVGRVNAISGKEHDLKIRPHRQDYIVIPDQQWLDGINSGSGSVSQFVAMPLGKGYTVEAQVTDEEKHGGFQLAIFDPRSGRFQEQDPKEKEAAIASRKQRAFRAAQQEIISQLPSITARVIRAVQEQHYQDAAAALGMSENAILHIIEGARLQMENALGVNGFEGVMPEAHLRARRDESVPRFKPEGRGPSEAKFQPKASFQPKADLSAIRHRRPMSEPVIEMGIARGGKIKQQIIEDTYGAESWDEAAFRDVVIHIVNSEVYQHITGCEAPPSPITDEQYRSCKIPWYSDYKEKAPSLSPVAVFKRVLSIGQIDKNRGIAKEEAPLRREIQPEEILRIRTETLEERWEALLERAEQSLANGRHRIAVREASLALDIMRHPKPLLIRAKGNLLLDLNADAEADATACLELEPDNDVALRVRAYSSLGLGENLLAKKDAKQVLAVEPNDSTALYVLAEASLRLADYRAAVNFAQRMLRSDPADAEALRIQLEAQARLEEMVIEAQNGTPLGQADAALFGWLTAQGMKDEVIEEIKATGVEKWERWGEIENALKNERDVAKLRSLRNIRSQLL